VTGSDSVVAVDGLHAGYAIDGHHLPVLRGIDLTIEAGELVALLGRNGSGKTTLLRCLAGTHPPEGGTVRLFGRDIGEWSRAEVARRVADLPQWLELPDGFRVRELVEMGRLPHATRLFGVDEADLEAIDRALADADATELADRYPTQLSGGERQRAVIAMALAQEPDLLLLDEPTLHLDLGHAATLLASIQLLRRRRSLTVVAVLHDLNLAAAYAPRVILLADGRVAADGPPGEMLTVGRVRDGFGVALEEAVTADGRRVLVPRRTGVTELTIAASGAAMTATPAAVGWNTNAIGPQGRRSTKGMQAMSTKRTTDDDSAPVEPASKDEQADTEGHFLLPDVGASQVLATDRRREVDRIVRDKQREQQAKSNQKRGR
jgi:iron complex transport system ATP-binding protein